LASGNGLTGEVLETQRTYWTQQFAGEVPVLALPTDHPRPPIQKLSRRDAAPDVGAEADDAIEQVSQQAGTTLFMTLLAAFATVLARYSGQTDLVIGSPIAKSESAGIRTAHRVFCEHVGVAARFVGQSHLSGLVSAGPPGSLDAYAHQDFPFDHLVEEVHPARQLNQQPLVQVMFAFQNMPMPSWDLPGLQVSPVEVDLGSRSSIWNVICGKSTTSFRGPLCTMRTS